jgi:hypothetical protein
MKTFPVKGGNGRWLTPCNPARARQLLKRGQAVKRYSDAGVAYLQLTVRVAQLVAPTKEAA